MSTATMTMTSTAAASGWVWMKGESVAIADPIAPTSDEDDRPAVKELIQEHREPIDSLKNRLQDHPLYEPKKHDDLWILRFLLSHKKEEPALKAIEHTLEFRNSEKLDQTDIRSVHVGRDFNSDKCHPAALHYLRCCDSNTLRLVVKDRCVVSYVSFAGIDQPKLLEEMDEKEWHYSYVMIAEWTHQWLDYLTRTTGRLTKTIRLVDLSDVSLGKNGNLTAHKRDGKALNSMEDYYPQLLQSLYLIHAPIWVEAPWKAIRPLIPKRVLKKFDFLEPASKEKDLKKLTKLVDIDNLPSYLGGNMKCWPDDTPPPNVNDVDPETEVEI